MMVYEPPAAWGRKSAFHATGRCFAGCGNPNSQPGVHSSSPQLLHFTVPLRSVGPVGPHVCSVRFAVSTPGGCQCPACVWTSRTQSPPAPTVDGVAPVSGKVAGGTECSAADGSLSPPHVFLHASKDGDTPAMRQPMAQLGIAHDDDCPREQCPASRQRRKQSGSVVPPALCRPTTASTVYEEAPSVDTTVTVTFALALGVSP